MAQYLEMPRLSDTMQEGRVLRWLKKEGDKVAPGDILAEVETDKANMDFEAYDEGVLLKILVPGGGTAAVGGPVAILGKAGEDISSLVSGAGGKGGGQKAAAPKPEAKPEAKASAKSEAPQGGKVAGKPKPQPEVEPGQEEEAKAEAQEMAEGDEGTSATDDEQPEQEAAAEGDERQAPQRPQAAAQKQGQSTPQPPRPIAPTQPMASRPAAKPSTNGHGQVSSSSYGAPQERGRPASPLARRIADERGVDIGQVRGSGPGGRVVKRDVENAEPMAARSAETSPPPRQAPMGKTPATQPSAGRPSAAPASAAAIPALEAQEVPLSMMRKTIAERMSYAKQAIPHFYLTTNVDMDAAVRFRTDVLAALGAKVSYNDLVIKAASLALHRVPEVNASFADDRVLRHGAVHIGVAVAIEDGLITPIIRDADRKSVGTIAAEMEALAARAKARKLKPDEYTGATFTISNLGMFGIDEFSAIVNPPEAAILAVGRVTKQPVVRPRPKGDAKEYEDGDDEIVVGHRMALTLSCDHRVLDGAIGARFLKELANLLEHPMTLAM